MNRTMNRIFSALRSLAFVTLALAGAALTAAPQAQAANFLEKGIYLSGPRWDGDLPPCEYALDTIASRFSQKEGGFWNSALQIQGFDKVREIAFRPWAAESIPRRFCTARAMISDGIARDVHFSIIEDGGFAGFGSGVEFCVVGLDRNWAYNPRCRMAKPR
jgi:hypothetical protein